jgi:poly(A) polymerase
VKAGWDQRLAKRVPPFPALQEAIDEVFEARIGDVSGRGKLAADMREIWMMQPRFEKRVGSAPFSLVEQARFRAGFDFLRLRAEVAEVDVTLADWWQEFSVADDAAREDLIQQAKSEKTSNPHADPSKPRRAPRRRKPASKGQAGGAESSGDSPGP